MTVHCAGLVVHIKNRIIQRCAICGEKLVDVTTNETKAAKLLVYPTGHSVRVHDGGFMELVIGEVCPNGREQIPEGFCIELVEY